MLVLLWGIGRTIGQDAIDHADGFVTDSDERPLSGTFPRRLLLSSLIVGGEMRLMRDQPQGIVIEPVSEVGTAHVRYLWELPDTRATFKQADVEACQFDKLFPIGVLADIADGGQDSRRGRFTDPGQSHEHLKVWPLLKQLDGLVEPQMLFGQGVSQVVGQGFDFKCVDTVRICETDTLFGKVIDALKPLRAPLTTATAGLPLFQEASAAVTQDGLWGCIRLQEASRGGLRQILHQRIEFRKRQVNGRSQLIAQLAHPFFQGHVSLHQAVGSPELRIAFHGQEEFALEEQVEDTVRIFFVGFTGAIRHRFAIIADRLTVHQTDTVPTAFEPFVERLPVDPGGLHGDQRPSTVGFDEVIPEGLLKELEALPGVGEFKLAAADACLRPQTGTVFGFAHIDSNE
jgi:hypothetical protein